MAETKGIRAGRAYVELYANDSKLIRGLRRASARLRKFGDAVGNMGAKLMRLGALVAAPLLAATKVFSKMGDDLAKMAKRTGFTVESLSQLAYAADISGASVEDLEKSIRRMQGSIIDAELGLSTATDALDALGLTVQDLLQLKPEEQFKLIAQRLSEVSDPTLKAATAMKLFGRSGTKLLPMLAGGAAGIEELQRQAHELGLTMSTEDAEAAEQFTDTMATLWKVIKRGVFAVGATLAPMLEKAAEWLVRVAQDTRRWVEDNGELINSLLKTAVQVAAVGAALLVVGKIITALSVLVKVATVVWAAFAVVKAFATQHPIVAAAIVVGMAAAVTASAIKIGRMLDKVRRQSEAASKVMEKLRKPLAPGPEADDDRGLGLAAAEELKRVEKLEDLYKQLGVAEHNMRRQEMTDTERRLDDINAEEKALKGILDQLAKIQYELDASDAVFTDLRERRTAITQLMANRRGTVISAEAAEREAAKWQERIAGRMSVTGEDVTTAKLRLRYADEARRREKAGIKEAMPSFAKFVDTVTEGAYRWREAAGPMTAKGGFQLGRLLGFQAVADRTNERIAAGVERTAQEIERLRDDVKQNQLSFGT